MTGDACPQGEKSDLIEKYSTSFVPETERHGRVRDLFTLWFTTNIAPLPIVTGATLFVQSHLSLFWCMTAIVMGHVLGAIVLGACSAQGPRIGLAQMVQARGQFGRYGSIIITIISSILYFGFFTSNTVLAGQALHNVTALLPIKTATFLSALCAVAIGILGYKTIHWLNRCGIWFMATALIVAFSMILRQAPPHIWASGAFNLWGWSLTFTSALVWNTSYACYTSDYSRYLPRSVGLSGPFATSFAGAACGASLSFIFGAFVAASMPGMADPLHALSVASGAFALPLLLLFVLNIISHNALNAYGAGLSIITLIQTFRAQWVPQRPARICISSAILAAGLTLAVSFTSTVVPVFLNIVFALLIALVPWITINLIDFYLIKKGDYDVSSFLRADGGAYGLVNKPAIVAFAVGVAVQIPFAQNAFFSGPLCGLFNAIDIGWLLSPPVTAATFYLLRRKAQLKNNPKILIFP